MPFRLRAFGWHLTASLIALTALLGGLYAGWYRWPGWYLADVSQVLLVVAGVDLMIGPLLTLVIADPAKPRRALARDVSVIAILQLVALSYGMASVWNGRPLYYAFSENVLQLVQAYDIGAEERDRARREDVPLRPHWYSLPRWIWAPLPQDPEEHDKIMTSAITGGDDVIAMPRYYKPWEDGLPLLRGQLKKVGDVGYFSVKEKELLAQRMRTAGLSPDQSNAIPLTGRGPPLLAVFDPGTVEMKAILKAR